MNDVSAGTQAGKSRWGPVDASVWLAAMAWGFALLVILGLLLLGIFGTGRADAPPVCWMIFYSLPVLAGCSFICGLSAAISGFVVLVSPSQKGAKAFGSAFFGFLFGLIYCVIVVSVIVVIWAACVR
jgi:hypothetical protein